MLRKKPQFDTLEEAVTPTRQAAVRLLARREYGAKELRDSLRQKGYPHEAVESVVNALQDKDIQSDERFVEVFVRSKKSRGQGPVRIRAELEQLAVNGDLIDRHLNEEDEEWFLLACQQRKKRFGIDTKLSLEDKARQQRYLLHKGFSYSHIKAALNDSAD